MSEEREAAREPEDITRLIVERVRAGDAEGIAALYEPDAVLAYPPGEMTIGRDAIRGLYEQMVASNVRFAPEEPLTTLRLGDIALTSTRAGDEAARGHRWCVASRTGPGSGSWTARTSAGSDRQEIRCAVRLSSVTGRVHEGLDLPERLAGSGGPEPDQPDHVGRRHPRRYEREEPTGASLGPA